MNQVILTGVKLKIVLSTNVAITGNNLVKEDPLNSDMISVHEEKMQYKSVYKEIKARHLGATFVNIKPQEMIF